MNDADWSAGKKTKREETTTKKNQKLKDDGSVNIDYYLSLPKCQKWLERELGEARYVGTRPLPPSTAIQDADILALLNQEAREFGWLPREGVETASQEADT